MKRKLPLLFIVLICFCSLIVLSSCDVVLDLIFGTKDPNDNPNNEPPAHTHKMEAETYDGETCMGQKEITYYKCSVCNKCFLDSEGDNEIADISELAKGHLYVIKITESEHYFECSLCKTEQDASRGQHSSERYWYNPTEHYKLCDVCGAKFGVGNHDETGSCTVCGRKADYAAMCNSRYGHDQLASLEHGTDMQKLYKKIDDAVTAVHDNANYNIAKKIIGTDAETNETIEDYALNKISYLDSSISSNEARATIACYLNDNPLYYWISKQFWVDATSITICVIPEYANGSDRAAQNEVIYSEIDRYLSYVADETDPYYITLALHDEIIDSIDYALKSDGKTPQDELWAHSIVGVFDNKSAVCEGYAKAFQLLLNACDVDNVYVTGSSKGEGHAWNTVKMSNDEWYWYDLTWDDQPSEINGKTHAYFCKTDGAFNSDHNVRASNIQDGVNYLYALPAAATTDYASGNWEVGEEITIDSDLTITYALVGYNRLAVVKIISAGEDGIVSLPSTVSHNGKSYSVKQINNEALITYKQGVNDMLFGPKITKIVIPVSVDTIFNKSFCDCSTLKYVQFEDVNNWQRYALNGQEPKYETISATDLTSETTARRLLQELYKPSLFSGGYRYVWTKTAE